MTNLTRTSLNNGQVVGPQNECRVSPDEFPKYPAHKDSEVEWLGEVPSTWRIILGKRLFHNSRVSAKPDSEQLAATQAYGVIPQKEFMEQQGHKVVLALSGTGNFKDVQVGDFVISLRSFQGGLEYSDYDGCVSPAYTVLRPAMTAVFQPNYFKFLLKSDEYIAALQSVTTGIREGRTITYEQFGSLPLPVPPATEQTQIARFLDHEIARIDALIEEQQRLIELLKEKRQTVISLAVTKGLDLKVPMKDSGVEWLGEVPAHWKYTKLGRLAFMQEGPGLRTWQFTDQGTRVICVTNITENGIDFDKLEKFISEDEYRSSYRHFTVKQGDLLLSRSGNSWGKVAEYIAVEPVILNTSTIRLNELVPLRLKRKFLRWFLESKACREQLDVAMTGACQPNFGPTHLNEVVTVCPPVQEQIAIANYLDINVSEFRELIRVALDAVVILKERRSALISAAVTGKIDVRGWQPPANAKLLELAQEAV